MSEFDNTRPCSNTDGEPAASGETPSASAAPQGLQQMLQALWQTSLQTIAERVDAVRLAHDLGVKGSLDADTRLLAAQAAHKLAGVLGTFGLPRGSEVGRSAERLLEKPDPLTDSDVAQLGKCVDELDSLIASKSAPSPTTEK